MVHAYTSSSSQWIMVSLVALAIFLSLANAELERLHLTIPWPSGIVIDSVRDEFGHVHRFGRLQSNAVQMRPEWSEVYMMQSFLSISQCSSIIEKAESLASQQGWSKARHVDYAVRPTKDHAVRSLYKGENKEEYDTLIKDMLDNLAPRLSIVYGLPDAVFEINDLFITKYDSSTPENRLDPHTDKSPWSFVVSLNDGFEGGGTMIMATSRVYRAPAGGVVFFSGNNLHAGLPTTNGVRYILAGFVEEYVLNNSKTTYSDRSNEFGEAKFFKYYDPKYDGYAGMSGFRSGDRIIGIEVCSLSPTSLYTSDRIDATISGISGSEGGATPSPAGENNNDYDNDDGNDDKHAPVTTAVQRRLVQVTGSMTDDEWIAAATSCEQLAPGEPTVLEVLRSSSGSVISS